VATKPTDKKTPVDGGLPDQDPATTALTGAALTTAAPGGPPADLADDMEALAGAGISDRPEDASTPWLVVLQKGSPEVNKHEPEYVPGAEAGDFMHSITKRLWKQAEGGPCVLQAFFQKNEVEWVPRGSGGGYVATHDANTALGRQVTLVQAPGGSKRMLRMLPNGNQLVETNYHFLIDVDAMDMMVLGLTSTGLGFSRRWTAAMKSHKIRGANGPVIAPSFTRVYQLKTLYQKNDQGDWFVPVAEDLGWVQTGTDQRFAYEAAKKFFLQANSMGSVPMGRPADSGSTIDAAPAEDSGPL
jgi:hypothetical protein